MCKHRSTCFRPLKAFPTPLRQTILHFLSLGGLTCSSQPLLMFTHYLIPPSGSSGSSPRLHGCGPEVYVIYRMAVMNCGFKMVLASRREGGMHPRKVELVFFLSLSLLSGTRPHSPADYLSREKQCRKKTQGTALCSAKMPLSFWAKKKKESVP